MMSFYLSLVEESNQMLTTCEVLFKCYWFFLVFEYVSNIAILVALVLFSSFLLFLFLLLDIRNDNSDFGPNYENITCMSSISTYLFGFCCLIKMIAIFFNMPEHFIRGDLVNNQLSACLLTVNILLA